MENHFTVNEVKHGDGSRNYDLVQFDGNRRITLHTTCLREDQAQMMANNLNRNLLSVSVDVFKGN